MYRLVNLFLVLIIGLGLNSCGKVLNNELVGWNKYVDAEDDVFYHIGIDDQVSFEGENCAYLSSDNAGVDDFGTLMQACWAKEFSAHRVKFSAYVKTSNVTSWGGLWFRVDDIDGNVLSFENMLSRPIKGTTDWTMYSIILDVPRKSARLLYGVLLYGTGNVWIDKVSLERIESLNSDTTEVIEFNEEISGYKAPFNLDFEGSNK